MNNEHVLLLEKKADYIRLIIPLKLRLFIKSIVNKNKKSKLIQPIKIVTS